MQNDRKINLEYSFNTRDLGGFVTNDKKYVKKQKIIRSDNTAYLSVNDINFLKEYGVKTIIDIRSKKEHFEEKDIMSTIPYFNYVFIPFDSDDFAYNLSRNPHSLQISLLDGYLSLLQQKDTVKAIMLQIERSLVEGSVLFHCSGGKDRTGLISMLILSILGIDKEEILYDYHLSYENLLESDIFRKWTERFGTEYIYCSPDLMRNTMDAICKVHNSIINYLIHCGIDISIINSIRQQLLF